MLSKNYKKFIQKHQASIKAWLIFGIFMCFILIFFSDRDLSSLLTISSIISMFSFLMVIYKIELSHSVKGVSLVMFEVYVVMYVCRLIAIIPYEGYLPTDSTGNWIYPLTEAACCMLAGSVVYLCRVRFPKTYNKEADGINHFIILLPTALLALILHPKLNNNTPTDISWIYALYIECFCCLPQLFMFHQEDQVQPFLTHFLACQVLSKVISFLFWLMCYKELNNKNPIGVLNYIPWFKVGTWVVMLQFGQLVFMADFIYHYIRCISRGVPVQYIVADQV